MQGILFQWRVQEKTVRQLHPLSPYMAPAVGPKLKDVIKQFMVDVEKTEIRIWLILCAVCVWCGPCVLRGSWQVKGRNCTTVQPLPVMQSRGAAQPPWVWGNARHVWLFSIKSTSTHSESFPFTDLLPPVPQPRLLFLKLLKSILLAVIPLPLFFAGIFSSTAGPPVHICF